MKKILITGSCGFIGSNFVRYATYNKLPYQISSVDKLVYQHSKNNLYINKDHSFYMGDICDFHFMKNVFELEKPNIVINFAAETHVDQSIENPVNIIDVNVKGTQILLDLSVKNKIEKFVQVSTDEVYGHLQDNDKPWIEDDKTNPRNPYSASKLAAEHLVRACSNTFGLNHIITRSCNNFGIRQSTRNLIPKIIKNVLANEEMPIYGTGMNVREWISAEDHVSAILKVLESNRVNETFNVSTGWEISNLEMFHLVTSFLNKGHDLIRFVQDRPGHDFRYAIDNTKLVGLGWKPSSSFKKQLERAVNWYVNNQWFLR